MDSQPLPPDQVQTPQQTEPEKPVVTVVNGPPDITEVKPAWYWIKDTRGYGSVTVTMVFVAFWVTTLAYVLSIFNKIGPVSIRSFDVAACSSYFGLILATYMGRKWTDAKYGNSN